MVQYATYRRVMGKSETSSTHVLKIDFFSEVGDSLHPVVKNLTFFVYFHMHRQTVDISMREKEYIFHKVALDNVFLRKPNHTQIIIKAEI